MEAIKIPCQVSVVHNFSWCPGFWKGTEYFAAAGCAPEISWDWEQRDVGYVKMRTAKLLFQYNVAWDSLHCVFLIKLKSG